MRTITNLINPAIHVYVCFSTKDLCRRFLRQAEWERFTIGERGKPTDIEPTDMLAVLPQKKLCHLGWASRMAHFTNSKNVVRVDFERYINGEGEYILRASDHQSKC